MGNDLSDRLLDRSSGHPSDLPNGITFVRSLRGHTDYVGRIAWSRDGRLLASPSADQTIRLWDSETGECLRTLTGHSDVVFAVAFDPSGQALASAGLDDCVMLWSTATGMRRRLLGKHRNGAFTVAFDPADRLLVSGGNDGSIKVWNPASGSLLYSLNGHAGSVNSVAFVSPDQRLASGSLDQTVGRWNVSEASWLEPMRGHQSSILTIAVAPNTKIVASGSQDKTIRLWDFATGQLIREIEGHTAMLQSVAFSPDGELMASKACDGTLRLWKTTPGACLATIVEPTDPRNWAPGIAFHPTLPIFATVGSDRDRPKEERDRDIHIYAFDRHKLLAAVEQPVTYCSAKIVLVGDSGVGKTGLGWRLARGEFREHASTHGQQFWRLEQVDRIRSDGAQCEAVLWDLAGQPDYRLIHALFVDDADLALVLFDPTRHDDPLHGADYWLKQLQQRGNGGDVPNDFRPDETARAGRKTCATVLVAARCDRGDGWLTSDQLRAFCERRGVAAYHATSALTNRGVTELIDRMKTLIPWEEKPATVTTDTFKKIKDFVLALKVDNTAPSKTLTPAELRHYLASRNPEWRFSDDEVMAAVGHLANHGYVTRLTTSRGEPRILLAPELLNNLAASFVLEARRNEKGLGALEEKRLLAGDYRFPELADLPDGERAILIDAAEALFLSRNVCFRETDPLTSTAYLVFPELINLTKPAFEDEGPIDYGMSYSVSGAVETVYASLVVLLGYTNTFTRRDQWRDHARYEVGNGLLCGFRRESMGEGQVDFVLYFGKAVSAPVRMLFQSLIENFLARRNVTVTRYSPVQCSQGHAINRAVIREQSVSGARVVFCNRCGEEITLASPDRTVRVGQPVADDVETQRTAADRRSRFEQASFRLKTFAMNQPIAPPDCFISYAWGIREHEQWVERRLATDLLNAGIKVILDRWEARIGASLPRFTERIAKCGRIVVVGTPEYKRKYENEEPVYGSMVAAECDLIGQRMIGSEASKRSVLPILLAGAEALSFPPLLHGRVYADFRKSDAYFNSVLDLLLSLYDIAPTQQIAIDLRELVGRSDGLQHGD